MAGGPIQGDELSKEPLLTQLKSFTGVYWIANWMELVERFAYYGVRVVLPVFMVAAFEMGGPQLDHRQKGTIYAVWAIVQSFIPILSGGFADRYGYKVNIASSTVLKIMGYLLMGYCIYLAEALAGMPLAEARPQGLDHVYEIFFAGAMLLALGTAIFKPGVQGLIANEIPKKSASLGWSVFYQMVNIGGFIGPMLAGYLRVMSWDYVFLACAGGIALNFIPLFLFKEPEHAASHDDDEGPIKLLYDAMRGLLEPRLFFFTISFAGFWLMFYQLFDILPNFIDDWVDSRSVAEALAGVFGSVPTVNGGNLTQEWMLNLNALLISFFAFAMGYITGKVRSLTAIVAGIAISAVGIFMLGQSMSGWVILGAIALFSVGEMSASPTKMRFLSALAPPGKQGQYMGYANFTVGIGWSVGSVIAGGLYEAGGDKLNLAKRYLVEKANVSQATVDGLGRGKIEQFFMDTVGGDAWEMRQRLWDTYTPQSMWTIFMIIGLCAMAAIVIYDQVVRRANANPAHQLNTNGAFWVKAFLVPIFGLFIYFTVTEAQANDAFPLGLALNSAFFGVMTLIALTAKENADTPAPG